MIWLKWWNNNQRYSQIKQLFIMNRSLNQTINLFVSRLSYFSQPLLIAPVNRFQQLRPIGESESY